MSSTSIIRVGVIGFGFGARTFHVPLLQRSARYQITHVLERSSSNSADVIKPVPTIARTLDELLAAPIELVVVATPTGAHMEQCRRAILAGKHVVVDKPLCVRGADAEALVALAKEHNVVFSVFQNRRLDSDFLTLQRVLTREDAPLGELEYCEIRYDRFRPAIKDNWRETPVEGGGIVFDLGAHLVDQALLLFGEPTKRTSDVQIQRQGAQNDDYFRLEWEYDTTKADSSKLKVKKVVITAGMLADTPEPRLKYLVHGTKGTFEKHGEDLQESLLKQGKGPGDAGYGIEPETQWATLQNGAGEVVERIPSDVGRYQDLYENVADVIQGHGGAKLFVDPHSVVTQIHILEQAKKTTRVCLVATKTE